MKKILLTLGVILSIFCISSCVPDKKQSDAINEIVNPDNKDETADGKKDETISDTTEDTTIKHVSAPDPIFTKNDSTITDTGTKTFTAESAIETVKAMKTGWNLGNTLDATYGAGLNSETGWGQPKTTKAMIDGLKASGMKTIRIPVSWSNHIIDSNYTIAPEWMARVKQIVDWAIEDDLYVILNIHHDNGGSPAQLQRGKGFYPNKLNYDESLRFIVNVWSQISLAFNNGYDEHLLFEVLNEPRLCGTNYEWWYDANSTECQESAEVLNDYNQVALDTIRNSGGNNKKRFVLIPGLRADLGCATLDAFKMPQDLETGRLILSVHMYSPYDFAMNKTGTKEFTPSLGSQLAQSFKILNNRFISKGYGVIIGEYGATNKNNLEERVKWFQFFIKYSRKYGITSCLWDNGVWDVSNTTDYGEKFGFYNRTAQTWYFPEILDAIMTEANASIQ